MRKFASYSILLNTEWLQVCDLQFYDDFFEIDPGAVKEIQESLDAIYGPMSSVEAEDNPTPGKEEDIGDASLHTVDSAGIGSNIALPGLRQRGACRQQEGRDDNDFSPQAVPDNQQVATAESTSSSGLWIIPCFELSRSRNGTKAVHLNVTGGKYDAELFQSFREEYFKESSWFRRLFLLREVKAIKFINVRLSTAPQWQ
jgi:hypothetical protein